MRRYKVDPAWLMECTAINSNALKNALIHVGLTNTRPTYAVLRNESFNLLTFDPGITVVLTMSIH